MPLRKFMALIRWNPASNLPFQRSAALGGPFFCATFIERCPAKAGQLFLAARAQNVRRMENRPRVEMAQIQPLEASHFVWAFCSVHVLVPIVGYSTYPSLGEVYWAFRSDAFDGCKVRELLPRVADGR